MEKKTKNATQNAAREKFLGLSLESTRKSYYPQLKKQLEKIEENERRLQLLIDTLPARISYINQEERYVLVNHAYEIDFQIPCHQIVGKTIPELLGQENYQIIAPKIKKALQGQQIRFETSYLRKDGSTGWQEATYTPEFDERGMVIGIYGLIIDLTEKKMAEKRQQELEIKLQDAQRIQAIGTLAGGLAHDFNNLMTGVKGRASLMLAQLEISDPMVEHLRAIEEYVESATHLTRQLLGFARSGKYEVTATSLNSLVTKCISMFSRTNKDIHIHQKYGEEELVAEIDRSQMDQVLLNIFVNAKQAMPEGGNLYLETRSVHLDTLFCTPYNINPGRFGLITISDDGCGMTEDQKRQVFDPFYTTKEKQRGTGLGLASAYGIIKNHNGIITVYSEVNKGSTFNIYLPLSRSDALEVQEDKTIQIVKGTGTILLVDDETIILEIGLSMLESLGYTPLCARGGRQALQMLDEKNGRVELVILDMVMPDMDGGRTFSEIQRRYPEIKVLLSSGYSIDGQARKVMEQGCSGFIQKPFNLADFSRAIDRIIN